MSKPSEQPPVEDELQTPTEAVESSGPEVEAPAEAVEKSGPEPVEKSGPEPVEVADEVEVPAEAVEVEAPAEPDHEGEEPDDEGEQVESAGQERDRVDRSALLRRVGGLAVVALVVPAVLVLLFAWPAGRQEPHGVHVVVTGAGVQNTALAQGVQKQVGGTLEVTTVKDAAAATAAVRDRKAAAAVVLEKDGLRLVVATAAQPTVALDVYRLMQAIQSQSQIGLTVDDVVPGSARDSRQYVLAAGLLALLASSAAVGGLIWRVSRSAVERSIALVAGSLVAGAASAVALHQVLGALTGSLPAEAGVLALVALAVSAATVACGALARRAGIGVAALVLVAASYPLSGATTPREVLPSPWGAVGGLLPSGAGVDVVRSVSFFGGRGSLPALGALVAWSVVGLLVIGARDVLDRRGAGSRPSVAARGAAGAPAADAADAADASAAAAAAAAAKPVHPARGRVSSSR